MTELLTLRDKIKNIYGRFDLIFDYLLKFAAAFASFMVINHMTGYNRKLSSVFVALIMTVACTFLPAGITVVAACGLILLQLYGLSIEFAAVTLVMLFIMVCAYFVFAPKTGYVLLIVPLLFIIRLPYAVPVLVGLTAGAAGIVPAIFGTYLYFTLEFSAEYAIAVASFSEGDFVQKITFIMDNTIMNKEMLVMSIVFAATIALVFVIRNFSMNYSWMIAIITGSLVEAVLVVMSHVMLLLEFSMPGLIIGIVLTILIGIVLHFFIFSVDYTRTERVQFEDDDYYYYVKAVPKLTVAKQDVKVKKINSRKWEEEAAPENEEYTEYTEYNEYAEPETEYDVKQDVDAYEDDEDKRKAYEQDIEDLGEEE